MASLAVFSKEWSTYVCGRSSASPCDDCIFYAGGNFCLLLDGYIYG